MYKLTSTPSKKSKINLQKVKKKRNLQKVVTKYRYTCESEIGHGIHGPLPNLIKLSKSSDHCEQIVLIAFLLLEIVKIKSKRIAIIHFDKIDPLWSQFLFKVTNFFPGVTVTNNVGEYFRNSSNPVLVSNYNCVKGLEFSELLLTLDADEYHLKQFIPEAMARCMSNLTILIRSKPKSNHKSDTVVDLVHHWEKSNKKNVETKESMLTILKLKFCSEHNSTQNENCEKTHCKADKKNYTSYKIHKRCERYRDLSIKIQRSYQSLHLEEKEISDEAEAV